MLLVAPNDDPRSPPLRTLETLQRETAARVAAFSDLAGDARDRALLQQRRSGRRIRRDCATHPPAWKRGPFRSTVWRSCTSKARPATSASPPRWPEPRFPSGASADSKSSQRRSDTPRCPLCRLLLAPTEVQRSALIDWLSHRSLRERPLGITRRPGAWDRVAIEAGLNRDLQRDHGWTARLDRDNPQRGRSRPAQDHHQSVRAQPRAQCRRYLGAGSASPA